MQPPTSSAKRVAFFGGSFDPPHCGHLAIAGAALARLKLDSVLFAPVGTQPLKPSGSSASFEDRVAMTRLAIASDPAFSVSLVDAPKPSALPNHPPNYTIDTLLYLRQQVRPPGTLYCLMGADAFLSIARWHRAAEIPFIAPLVIAARPGQVLDDLKSALPQGLSFLPAPAGVSSSAFQPDRDQADTYLVRNSAGECAPLFVLPGLHFDISATQIRDQIRDAIRERRCGGMDAASAAIPQQDRLLAPAVLSPAVLDYIRAHCLYR
jgi:nicotinate-nucleotide adenylyltransferase